MLMRKINLPGLKNHWTNKNGVMKPKRGFDSQFDAEEFIVKHNIDSRYRPYICEDCGKWHIGHFSK